MGFACGRSSRGILLGVGCCFYVVMVSALWKAHVRILFASVWDLIGSVVSSYFARELNYTIHSVDNNQRAVFFGPQGGTRWNQHRLVRELLGFIYLELDIRDRAGVLTLLKKVKPSAIVHTAIPSTILTTTPSAHDDTGVNS